MTYTQNFEHLNDGSNFSAYDDACEQARALGYSVGPMSHPHPTALIKGDAIIAKWKNLTVKERSQVDGIIEGDFRNGPVFLRIK